MMIPKPEGGEWKIGIPTVRDRVVRQALLDIVQPIFEEDFHPSSYGYRLGRSCHQVISKAAMFLRKYERKWVVDMNLSKCFDTLDHDPKLTVSVAKTHGAHAGIGVTFLGVIIKSGMASIQPKKIVAFMEKVKRITRRNAPVNLEKVIADLNPVIRGFGNNFRIANSKGVLEALPWWIRRRL